MIMNHAENLKAVKRKVLLSRSVFSHIIPKFRMSWNLAEASTNLYTPSSHQDYSRKEDVRNHFCTCRIRLRGNTTF